MAASDLTFTELPPFEELFDRPSLDDWRRAAEASLKGRPLEHLTVRTHEGIEVAPLYTEADVAGGVGYPGQHPFVRGRTALGPGAAAWEACQCVDHPDPDTAARWAAQDLDRGAASLWLVCDPVTRTVDSGAVEAHGPGVHLANSFDLEPLCRLVDLSSTPLQLDAGGNTVAVAAALIAAARRHRVNPHDLAGNLGFDPLAALAADGRLSAGLDGSLALLVELASWTERHAPGLRAVTVTSVPYHLAGATAVHELAISMATGVAYLRVLAGHGFDADRACRRIAFRHAVGRDLFTEAAKLRAGRRLWARVAEACGAAPDNRAAPIHAVASPRCLSRRDPWVNMLRTTVGAFAATVGGADLLTVLPFDAPLGISDELARRMAINSQTILREESHLGRVVDPGGGSWYLEWLTDELAREAWERFQTIEAAGGMREALLDGRIARDLDRLEADREQALATGRDPVTGVSSFPNLAERPVDRPPFRIATSDDRDPGAATEELARLLRVAASPVGDGAVVDAAVAAAAAGATIGQLAAALCGTGSRTIVEKLPANREARLFERLRDASDAWLESRGTRPRIFLASMGPAPENRPRATFAVNFFEAGGIEALTNDGFATVEAAAKAFADTDTRMAVICSSDARYPEVVPELAAALDALGARTVLLAGRPGEHEGDWREAGVTGFIHVGCDQYQLLVDLLQEEGVLHV